ncbi:hypothetical protein PRZ48_011539 [Zasmidium cellare]|uniref:Uncharacterized protein n=1 Tax=Zasmidium cellare TaxID=395010 RepID=A0ABR0E6M9_ZASCE|nr:hypothetical protein PRZ48_011539 [Zasmidium cellare]
MDPTPLKGKCAIVTGGSRGIGQGVAIELAKRGATVLITYATSVESANKTVSSIRDAGGKAHAVQADSSQAQDSAKKVVSAALEFFGGHIDIIVNNAGFPEPRPFDTVDTAFFDQMMHTNVLFPMLLFSASLPYLRKGVRIVNVSSIAARGPSAVTPTYAASKAALESVTRSMAAAVGRSLDGTANAVNPGPVATDMWHNTDLPDKPGVMKRIGAMTAAGDRIAEFDS